MKKTVKVKFVGFWQNFVPETTFIYSIINKFYNIEFSDEPDYIICAPFPDNNGSFYPYCAYPQIRIMDSGENYIPDFNLVDYAISPYPIDFSDRHCYFPQCLKNSSGLLDPLFNKNRNYPETILDEKPYFANFIASHESEGNIRGDFFKKLCEYKRVESPGSYLNNMDGNTGVSRKNGSKSDLQKKCKFTLCFESTKHEGFVTEKISDAFCADTIPVYYGSDEAKNIFNPKSFIHCSDYESFDKVIEKIIELDNDDEKYLEMLRQPIFNDDDYYNKKMAEAEAFVKNIFSQPVEKAYRRSMVYLPKYHENYINRVLNCDDDKEYSIKHKAKIIFNKLKK